MRAFLSILFLAFLGAVSALSSAGTRLLVVLEEASEKTLYSQFWADLEGMLDSEFVRRA
jgi:oligosaccharyltransferase complex subunit beta